MRNAPALVPLLLLTLLTQSRSAPPPTAAPGDKVPFELVGNALFVQVRVEGKGPFSFVLDTGAQASLLDASTARALGLGGEAGGHVMGAGGQVAGSTLGDVTLELGAGQLSLPDLMSVSLTPIANSLGRQVDGVLGSELFRRFVVEIDFEKQEIGLYEPAGFVYRGGGDVLPLTFHDALPYVRARLKLPGARGIEGEFVIDSGSNFPPIVLPAFVAGHGLEGSIPSTLQTFGHGVGGEIPLPLGRARCSASPETGWPSRCAATGGSSRSSSRRGG